LENITNHPTEAKYRTLKFSNAKVQQKLRTHGFAVLKQLGFQASSEACTLPDGAPLGPIEDAQELIRCMMLSEEDDTPGQPASKAPRSEEPSTDLRTDEEIAQSLAKEEEPKKVQFQRFESQDVVVTDEALNAVLEYCRGCGEQYVDVQFPPVFSNIYFDDNDAKQWKCGGCGHVMPLGDVPDPPNTKEEAEARQKEIDNLACEKCHRPAGQVVKVQKYMRPCQWLRPGLRCADCQMIYPSPDLSSRMCTHYLRDVTEVTLGNPWKVIREAARPEDVVQGSLGNCWFAAGLSVVAQYPELVAALFKSVEVNPAGVYVVRLCHGGIWKEIMIDDLFPTSKVFHGRYEGQMLYYSRGGTLSYLQCARRQLWVPLVEKAAAKLFGCYQALSSGTMKESFELFTGCSTEHVRLYIPSAERERKAAMRQAMMDERTQRLLRGEAVDDDEDDVLDEDDPDMLWSKLLSAREAGYLMGCACTAEGVETQREVMLERGLQSPHGYGVIDVREVLVNGKMERLLQIRNPWGERAERTWNGDWGKNSPLWTFDLKRKLGVVNASGINMYDDMSIFWMNFEDLRKNFVYLDICRVHPSWHTLREQGWLPSGVGAGDAFELEVYARTEIDIALWQEKHITRESAQHMQSTNVDLGFVVLRVDPKDPDNLTAVELCQRSVDDQVNQEVILEGGFRYRIVPLHFNQMSNYEPRRVLCSCMSRRKIGLAKVSHSHRVLGIAMCEAARLRGSTKRYSDPQAKMLGITSWFLQEGGMYSYAIENRGTQPYALQVDLSDSIGAVSSTGNLASFVAVAPMTRKFVVAVAKETGTDRFGASFLYDRLPADMGFAVEAEDCHMSLPVRQGAEVLPDPELLSRADDEPMNDADDAPEDDDEELRAALAMSMEQPDEDEDELQAALAMSMQPQTAAAPASAPKKPAAEDIKARVKARFTELVAAGKPPNEAAAQAMKDVQAEMAQSSA
jgi:calpain-15